MTRVVHLSSVHRASDTRIYYKECQTLAEAGYDVVLVARAEADRDNDGICVKALPNRGHNRLQRMTRSVLDTFLIGLRMQGDLYHLHDPELLPVGVVLKLLGKNVVFDVHEHIAKDIVSKPWIPKKLRPFVAWMYSAVERIGLYFVDAAVAATPAIANDISAKRVIVVQNFPRKDEFMSPNATYVSRKALVAYVGAITKVRGVVEWIEAMELVGRQHNVRLKLAGTFAPPSLEKQVEVLPGWERVDWLGQLDRREVVELLSEVRIGLVALLPAPNHINSQPNKLFEYMAAGIPVVASNFPYWRPFVEERRTGLLVDPTSPEDIANAITWLLDHPEEAAAMGERGRKAVRSEFSWEREGEKLLQLYDEILS